MFHVRTYNHFKQPTFRHIRVEKLIIRTNINKEFHLVEMGALEDVATELMAMTVITQQVGGQMSLA